MDKIDEYFAGKQLDNKELVIKYLKIAAKYCPGSVSAMPYGVAGLKYNNKNLIAVSAFKEHLGIYPMSPNIVELIANKYGISNISKGTFRFKYDDLPAEELIKDIVLQRKNEIS